MPQFMLSTNIVVGAIVTAVIHTAVWKDRVSLMLWDKIVVAQTFKDGTFRKNVVRQI